MSVFEGGSFPRCRNVLPNQCKCSMAKEENQTGTISLFSLCSSQAVYGEHLGKMSLQFSMAMLREVEVNKP